MQYFFSHHNVCVCVMNMQALGPREYPVGCEGGQTLASLPTHLGQCKHSSIPRTRALVWEQALFWGAVWASLQSRIQVWDAQKLNGVAEAPQLAAEWLEIVPGHRGMLRGWGGEW